MILLDTSVLVAAFTPDLHSDRVDRFVARGGPLIISDWAAAEFSSAIRNKVRQGIVVASGVGEVEAMFDAAAAHLGGRRSVVAQDHQVTRLLVSRHDPLRAPDALHLAIAIRLGADLATLDDQQAAAASQAGLTVSVL